MGQRPARKMSIVFTNWLQSIPCVKRIGWALRMIAITGPWHPLLLAFCQRRANNPRIAAPPNTLLPEMDPRRIVARLEQEGWAEGFLLPAEQINRILEFTERAPQQMYDEPHRHCETLREIACDANVLEVARMYLQSEPILYHSVIWRNTGVNNPDDVRDFHLYRFHFDVADVKSLALFIYLSDVDEREWPAHGHLRDASSQVIMEHGSTLS